MGFINGTAAGIVAIVALFIVLPSMIITAVRKNSRHKREVELEKLKYQKEILELEIEKQNYQIKLLEQENKKYDNIINGN
jgi:spore coat polysaccharide biosynthesis predicted glycosyltransferase SpsG